MSETIMFADLALSEPVMRAIQKVGYEQPSPIQAAAIPVLLAGGDILGMAQTGTGKTAAFALPLLSRIDTKQAEPQILVLAPTRELAIQVAEAFQKYASEIPGFHVLPIYGGQEMTTQLRSLKRGAHVVVGTPGRVMDHLRRGSLNLNNLKALVLDEADEMLRMGFIDDVEWILEHTPKTRQTALFSATMPKEIRHVCNNYLNNATEIKIASSQSTDANIEQVYWMVSGTNKLDALTRILEVEPFDGMIIFVRTKTATVELAEKLEARGYSAAALNGDMNQQLRERTIERLKTNKLDIVIATDVAARGIDVERVSHVVNYDIPYDSEAYVHRIGRTGRAGRSGKAILFVAPREKRLLYTIEKATKKPITLMELPSGATVTKHRIDQFTQQITDTLQAQGDLTFFNDLLAEYSHKNDVSPEQIASALAYLLQRERPLQVKFTDIKPERERSSRDERGGRDERSSRDSGRDRGPREDRPRRERNDENMDRYRIEVGRNHEARPGDIVGAIANEAGIESRFIGHIKLHDEFSTVDLPTGMSKDILAKLKKVRVRNRPLEISLDTGPRGGDDFSRKPKRDFGPRDGAPREGGRDKPRFGERDGKKTSFRPKKSD
ncbi:putative ATP-dependent RNA helicase DeaD [Cellvibrio sp. BR]|uniref:DEAD/DEAH box helicase n=1 Tax=unclassified Cellvibrio TaxID=2624793 RepID=UPI0002601016|nr:MULTISPECIES: DEAD/DEAH box helicase [unclassified Cellvibrio]EIK45172.1 putative ATP-dependent RNA helicase DeaD [Cellvibrio sp. BR]QEY13234.1 ATP-dependent helicase [Cellvibrio sp. KY-YJ-3]